MKVVHKTLKWHDEDVVKMEVVVEENEMNTDVEVENLPQTLADNLLVVVESVVEAVEVDRKASSEFPNSPFPVEVADAVPTALPVELHPA